MKRREFCGVASSFAAMSMAGRGWASAEVPAKGVAAIRLSGEATQIGKAAVDAFARSLKGALLLPGVAEYETARRVWNPMIDRRPALIARCANAGDVAQAVRFARKHELLVAVRGGGHSFPGYSTCDGGLMIDLSTQREVRVDAHRRVVTVAPGAWGADVDTTTEKHRLVTTMGQISDTGIAGLTLGGGYGWLSRRHGLACDNLVAVDLVTADGKQRRVSADEHADLFWAIRGGGGNFGVATSFEYRLHDHDPKVYASYIAHPLERLREVMELFEETMVHGPRELSLDLSIEASDKGEPLVAVYGCDSGDPAHGAALVAPFDRLGKPFQSVHGPDSYSRVQHQSDGPHLSKNYHYIKAGLVDGFKPELIDILKREFKPSGSIFIYMQNASGAVADVAPTATAFWNRKALVNLMVLGTWPNAADTEKNRADIRAIWDRIEPFTVGHYPNLSDSDAAKSQRLFGDNLARLQQLKRQYDPANQFRLNANIQPA